MIPGDSSRRSMVGSSQFPVNTRTPEPPNPRTLFALQPNHRTLEPSNAFVVNPCAE
jgi:hypothetical protein